VEIVTFAALVALSTKLVSFVKMALARDRGAVTQLVSWVVGIGVTFLAANAGLTTTLLIPGTDATFGQLDTWSAVLTGLALGSAGSLTYDAVGRRTWEPSLFAALDRKKYAKTELTDARPPEETEGP
jgi:hypothetical protein